MKRQSRAESSFRTCTDLALGLALAVACAQGVSAQTPPTLPSSPETAIAVEPTGEAATLEFFNRPIVTLRARVLGRPPSERAANAARTLEELVGAHATQPIEARPLAGALVITVAGRGVVAVTHADVDELSGQTVQQTADAAMTRLRQAIAEADEARMPGRLMRSGFMAVAGLAVGLLLIAALSRARRAIANKIEKVAEASAWKSGIVDTQFLHASRLLVFERRLVSLIAFVLQILIGYSTITFVLRRFPFTRPWGESMRAFLIKEMGNLALRFAEAMPGLFTIVLILLITRFVVRLIAFWFEAIERGRLAAPPWLHPETAAPTRRLVTAFTWLFALVLVYPYVPGSQTDAFKGVSVLVGLMVTLGSSGLVMQMMSSFMITYSRALRVGDYVRIGDVEGTVTYLGMLSTKIRTPRREEITIPNALVIGQTTTDYSRFADSDGVLTPTSVTIGYDAPWRQVHELLMLAAARTAGIRREPKPLVLQTALEDFYVKYTLLACFERQDARALTLAALHANIQDLFNEHGVQIMSPHYESDPASPKVVPKAHWFAAPAGNADSGVPKPVRSRDIGTR